MTITTLGPNSLEMVLQLQAECAEVAAWPASTWSSLLGADRAQGVWQRHVFGVFAEAQVLAGVCAVNLVDSNSELELLLVHPDWRRQGIGRALSVRWLAWARTQAGEGRHLDAFLEVRVSNAAAQRLYRELGFAEVARRTGYYRDPVEDALVMQKQLQADAQGSKTSKDATV